MTVQLHETGLTEEEYKALRLAIQIAWKSARDLGAHKDAQRIDSMARKLIGFNWNK